MLAGAVAYPLKNMLVAGDFKTGRNELKIGLVGDEISKKKRTGGIFMISILTMLLTRATPGLVPGSQNARFLAPQNTEIVVRTHPVLALEPAAQ